MTFSWDQLFYKNWHKNAYTHVDPGPALTLIVPDLQMGRRVLGVVSEDDRQAVHLSVLTAQVQRRLSITVQSSRVSACIQQSFHQIGWWVITAKCNGVCESEREKDKDCLLIQSIKSTVYLRPNYI